MTRTDSSRAVGESAARWIIDQPTVLLPPRAAVLVDRELQRADAYRRLRGAGIDDVLLAIRALADLARRGSVDGTTGVTATEPPAGSDLLTPRKAAARLGCTPHAVRRACREGRLLARQADGEWLISRTDLEQYRSRRAP